MRSTAARRTARGGARHVACVRSVPAVLPAVLLAVLLAGLSACGSSEQQDAEAASGETIRNCGVDVAADEPPKRVFAAYQPAIEMAHALGISDRLVGTAFLDAKVLPEHAAAQQGQQYYPELPSREELLSTEPDFVLSGFNGALTDENFGTRASLRELGIDSWIVSPLCPNADGAGDESIDPATVTIDAVYDDLRDLGAIFDVDERAEDVIADMEQTVSEVTDTVEAGVAEADRPTVAIGRPATDGFRIAGGPDISTELIDLAGGQNAFAELDSERNIDISTEELIERDPDYILVDVCCGAEMTAADAADDVETIMSDPALANLTAVTEGNVAEFTFADRSAGVRSAHAVTEIAELIHPELFE